MLNEQASVYPVAQTLLYSYNLSVGPAPPPLPDYTFTPLPHFSPLLIIIATDAATIYICFTRTLKRHIHDQRPGVLGLVHAHSKQHSKNY